jgi:uncharacterized membrane protein
MKVASWARSPIRRLGDVAWGSFWSLPIAMIAATLIVTTALLYADAAGASASIARLGWPLAMPGKTAQELASGLVGVHVTLVSLYFSISLLVLTLAGGTLGVRLIDIWIARKVTRVTLGLLLSGLTAALIVLAAIDPDANGGAVARLTVIMLMIVTIGLLGWLAFALHDLGRTIHIDTVIAYLRKRACEDACEFSRRVDAPAALDWGAARIIPAPRAGFVESVDFTALTRVAAKHDLRIEVTALAGDYRLPGEALGRVVGTLQEPAQLVGHFGIGGYRAASEGSSFEVRLLVEVAARALSPAVNDFYTALACVDALGSVMRAHGALRQDVPWLGDEDGVARVRVALAPFADLFDAPMKALRQAAAPYPSVAVHLILILRRVRQQIAEPGVRALIEAHVEAMCAHAMQLASYEPDAQAVERATTAELPAIA